MVTPSSQTQECLHAICTHRAPESDILTKDLTAYTHELARRGLRLQICDGLWFVWRVTRLQGAVHIDNLMFQTFIHI